jgi:hypothetical protein
MKNEILVLFFLSGNLFTDAQLTITTGASLTLSNNAQLALNNTDLIINGNFNTLNSTVHFTGNNSSNIRGTGIANFHQVVINKTGGQSVLLQKNINVNHRIDFVSGHLDLNGFNTELASSALIIGETSNARVIGSNGGEIFISAMLNAPSGINPGNLGASFTSSRSLGTVNIRRGHQQQNNVSGSNPSILRYYDITAERDGGTRTTLRLYYLEAELNGIAENNLVLYKQGRRNWANMGYSSRDALLNYVEKNDVNSLSRWTLASDNGEGDVVVGAGVKNNGQPHKVDAEIKNSVLVFPNPVKEKLFVQVKTTSQSQVIIEVFDAKGALVKTQHVDLVPGANRIQVDMVGILPGVYHVKVQTRDKRMNKTIPVVKM